MWFGAFLQPLCDWGTCININCWCLFLFGEYVGISYVFINNNRGHHIYRSNIQKKCLTAARCPAELVRYHPLQFVTIPLCVQPFVCRSLEEDSSV